MCLRKPSDPGLNKFIHHYRRCQRRTSTSRRRPSRPAVASTDISPKIAFTLTPGNPLVAYLCALEAKSTLLCTFHSEPKILMSYQISSSSLTPSRPAPQAPSVRRDMYSPTSSLASVGYNSAFTMSSASSSTYAPSYSGIGGSPNRPNSESIFNSQVVRSGLVNVKDDGFASWLWRPKWLILKEQALTIHKNEVSPCL
jgi:hypothetical protein